MVRSGVAIVPTLEATGCEGLGSFMDAGGMVALGNDGGCLEGIETTMPLRELELMRAAGLSRAEGIVAATRDAARVCRRDALLGTLEPGKAADVLVLNRDPLADLGALGDVRLVMRDGVIVHGAP
jgi:imidazolonepropionase-like amidohydrolase